jgi:tetratricopeptide (TPR) repeat protein
MALAWSGVDTSPQELVQEVYTPQKKGSLQPDLKAATRRHGRLAYEIFGLQELLSELSAGHPVIVLQNLGLSWLPRWHYAVVVGFDRSSQELLLHSGRAKGMRTGLRVFHRTWRRSDCWGLLVLEPGDLPATAKRTRYLEAVLGLEEAEKWRAAAKGYEAGLSRWPESITAVVGRASCLYRMGSLEAAEKMLKRGIERHPSKPELYNNLAHILMQLGKRREALQAARSAVDIGGSNKKVFEETLQEVQSKSR